MSHRAIVAERQPNERFNLYHSRNGAEDIQLLDELRESLNVHGRVDFEALTGETIPEAAKQIEHASESRYRVESGDTGNIVEPRPIATNVRQEALLLADDLLQFEVLYVVADGDVDAYWLTWTYPDVIRPWRDHVEMDVYDADGLPTRAADLMEYVEEGDPVRTITDFQQGWLSDDLVRTVVGDYHRWLYELHAMTVDEFDEDEGDDDEAPRRFIQTPEHCLVFRVDENTTLVPQSHPFVLPIRLGSSPMTSSERIREAAAQTRLSVGAGLNAAECVSEDALRQACADSLIEIVNQHLDQVATDFVPGALGGAIDEYRQSRDRQVLEEIWR
jgi:hypothetical protein